MSYQVLARKYRPQSFDAVLGQIATVQTLKNAISEQRLHHAYLFCGSRGVGKTSMARIFAKSLNCEKGPTQTPCEQCEACKGITASNSLDVREIDGASNTGVDDVRGLREQAKYLPVSRYKIFIIDEVHMLSQSAFNALLKILEEPPPHLLFVFATTEVHKIPITILSRCQRYDFKRLGAPELVGHLQKILAEEKMTVDHESLELIAHAADGSVRDSLSLLDQVISYCQNKITPDKVRDILGLAARPALFEILEGLMHANPQILFKKVDDLVSTGTDLKIFSEGLLELLRNILVLSEGGDKFVEAAPSEKEKLAVYKSLFPPVRFLHLFQILLKGTEELARSPYPRFVFETTLLKMLHAKDLLSIPQILEALKTAPINTGGSSSPSVASPSPTPVLWGEFVKKALELRPQIGAILEQARPIAISASAIALGFEASSIYKDMLVERLDSLKELVFAHFQRELAIDIKTLASATTHPKSALEMRLADEKKRMDELKEKTLANPIIQKAQEILGATVKEIKNLK